MRRLIILFLCLSMLVTGCKTQPVNEAGLYQRPGWWERRMDRLDDWNTHHGYVINKTKTAVLYTLVGIGAVAAFAGYVCYEIAADSLVNIGSATNPTRP